MDSLKKGGMQTPLYGWHKDHGASMEPFGGYLMPLWYGTGAKDEHLSVVTHSGIFDTSHMGIISVTGENAHGLLQWYFTRNLDACSDRERKPLRDGELVYGAFLNERGWCIDDAVVYRISQTRYIVVVNASMGETVTSHLKDPEKAAGVEIEDLTGRAGKIDIQGPLSPKILIKTLKNPDLLRGIRFFTFTGHYDPRYPEASRATLKNDTPILLSRSGYTGEIGFELLVSADRVVEVWENLMDAGRRLGITPCGLAARDSLRTGAGLPLSHQDIGNWPFVNHPWTFTLPFSGGGSGFSKNFLGARALANIESAEHTFAFVGMDPRKVDHNDAEVIGEGGRVIGRVLSCVTDMAIDRWNGRVYSIASPGKPDGFHPRGLSCGFVKISEKLDNGSKIIIRDRKRSLPVETTGLIRPDRTARMPVGKFLDPPPCTDPA